MTKDSISCVQMGCKNYRVSNQGDPDRLRIIPEIGLPRFPILCHIGTPCFAVRREWALESPWQDKPNHDFEFINTICQKYKPKIMISVGMQVEVDGLLGKVKDWVSRPPFYRG